MNNTENMIFVVEVVPANCIHLGIKEMVKEFGDNLYMSRQDEQVTCVVHQEMPSKFLNGYDTGNEATNVFLYATYVRHFITNACIPPTEKLKKRKRQTRRRNHLPTLHFFPQGLV